MNTRKIENMQKDLAALSPYDAQTVGSIAYQLRGVRRSDSTPSERAFARLLRDIANGQGEEVRIALIESSR